MQLNKIKMIRNEKLNPPSERRQSLHLQDLSKEKELNYIPFIHGTKFLKIKRTGSPEGKLLSHLKLNQLIAVAKNTRES